MRTALDKPENTFKHLKIEPITEHKIRVGLTKRAEKLIAN